MINSYVIFHFKYTFTRGIYPMNYRACIYFPRYLFDICRPTPNYHHGMLWSDVHNNMTQNTDMFVQLA